ncbi:hypothetical protein K445DRAFT_22008 [Daldinia sp. EC12]|nr:hypothetical protein K445DRAFT_22008 [Daldinia sp. EC12]
MDPLSITVSTVTLTGLAHSVLKKSARVYSRFKDASSELNSLKRYVESVQVMVKRVDDQIKQSTHISPSGSSLLSLSLGEIESALDDILRDSEQYVVGDKEGSKRLRLKWAVRGRGAFTRFQGRIDQTLPILQTAMLWNIIDKGDAILGHIIDPEVRKDKPDFEIKGTKPPNALPIPESHAEIPKIRGLSHQFNSCAYRSWPWLSSWRLIASAVYRKGDGAGTLSFSARCRFPRSNQLLMLEFVFYVLLRPFRAHGIRFNLGSLNVVPDEAEIVIACRKGDVDLVRSLFQERKGSIYDVTSKNLSLLYMAIESGSVSLVKFLLEAGADVNQTFGEYQTSSLQWALWRGMYDITRLLLNSHADGSHIGAWRGWNPLIYLLEGAQRFERVQPHCLLDFLDLLNHDKVHVDTEARDHTGHDALQLAAAWYPGNIVQRVFNLGASMVPYGQEPWRMPGNPIWNALCENNSSAFQVLLPRYPNLNALDQWGYRMINYTARYGYGELTEILLDLGVEEIIPEYEEGGGNGNEDGPDVLDTPNLPRVDRQHDTEPSDDQDTEGEHSDSKCDPANVEGLEIWTEENYFLYRDALIRRGRVVVHRRELDEDEDGGDDVFWNALSQPWGK